MKCKHLAQSMPVKSGQAICRVRALHGINLAPSGVVKAWQFAKQSLRAYHEGRLGHTVQALTGHIFV